MRKTVLLFILSAVIGTASAQNALQSPEAFLGYRLGSEYTLHYRVAEYFRYVAGQAKNVKLQEYGKTNEGRPLMVAFITAPENFGNLENIRRQNMDMVSGARTRGTGLPVVWLSFNVHGNEASSTEVAMQTLFDLVDPANTRTKPWLKNTVVVIDPCINPDGRDRYVNFYNPVHSRPANPDPQSREHMEPWPGGRSSHYYFDLNRDWAWQTQIETQQRLRLFNQWLPEVHVDFHEQGYNAPYYFAPAAEPFHTFITPWQREFQTTIGRNNAKYFDEKGWLYFTKERFDLLYPSYGDTYPIYNGSIGMTYEQGGIRAGLAVINADGDTLTLADRIAHHHSNALATIETTSQNAQKVTDEFAKFFADARSKPPGQYRSYVIKNNNPEMVKSLSELLDRNGIVYGYGSSASSGFGYNYVTGKDERFSVEKNDLVISSYQPKSVLLNVLFEPKTIVTDSNTYDITAWALPYAYGLKAYASKQSIKPSAAKPEAVFTPRNLPAKPYAYVAPWNSVSSVKFLSLLLNSGVKVRYSETPLSSSGKNYAAGSLLVTRAANAVLGNRLDALVRRAADSLKISLDALNSGFVEKGFDVGSDKVHLIRTPRVLTVSGEHVSSLAMGEIWQFFEQQIGYPLSIVREQDLERLNWSAYDVAVFADGNYAFLESETLQNWIKNGGKLIVLEGAASQLAGKKGFALKSKEQPKADPGKKPEAKTDYASLKAYENREREFLRYTIPGAIYRIDMDKSHPLGFGLPEYYFGLKLNDEVFAFMDDDSAWNVGTLKKNNYVSGFVGQKAKEKLKDGTVLGVQEMGRGSVVYMADDPLFRSFWENGKLLFSNAVFLVGN